MVPSISGQHKHTVKTRSFFLLSGEWNPTPPPSSLSTHCALCWLVESRPASFFTSHTTCIMLWTGSQKDKEVLKICCNFAKCWVQKLYFNSSALQEESALFLNPPRNGKVWNFESVYEKLDIWFSFIQYLIFEDIRITNIWVLLCIQYSIFNFQFFWKLICQENTQTIHLSMKH